MPVARRLALAGLAAVLAACPRSSKTPATCAANQVLCGSTCVSLSTDKANCGGCGLTCSDPVGGTAACVLGLCVPSCTAPGQLCEARATGGGGLTLVCVDVTRDPVNCGACGATCLPQQNCTSGQCVSCPSGQIQCPAAGAPGTACKAILSDNQNCGGCGNVCGVGSRCDNGACIAAGLSNCGNAGGGPATSRDLQNDPANCGACGNQCAFDPNSPPTPPLFVAGLYREVCRGGRCDPCPADVCGNVCADLQRDSRNCAACGTVCTGNSVCVAGACGPWIAATVLPPLSTGHVSPASFQAVIQVDSALPVQFVMAEGPDTNPVDSKPVARFLSLQSAANVPPRTLWTATLPSPSTDTATVLFTAVDAAWVAGAAGALLHQAQVATGAFAVDAPPASVPTIAASAAGAPVVSGSWVALDAAPITFTAGNLGPEVSEVAFVNRALGGAEIGRAPRQGSTAALTVAPGRMGSALGEARVVACAYAGENPTPICSDAPPPDTIPEIALTVGRIPGLPGGAPALLTAQPDGSAGSAWFMGQEGPVLAQLRGADAVAIGGPLGTLRRIPDGAILPSLAAVPPVSPLPYFALTLQRAETAAAVVAVSIEGGGIDRFECLPAAGGCTVARRSPWIAPTTVPLGGIAAVTGQVILLLDLAGAFQWAVPPDNASPTRALPIPGPAAYPLLAPLAYGAPVQTTAGGAVVFYTQSSALPGLGNSYQLKLASANRVVDVGPVQAGPPRGLLVFPSGEIIWESTDGAGGDFVWGARFDGTVLATTAAGTPVGGAFGFLLASPGKVLFQAGVAGATRLHLLDFTLVAPSIVAPTPATFGTTQVGGLVAGAIRSRLGAPDTVAISDDQLKALYVTVDQDAALGGTYTLWLLDLRTATAGPLHSSPRLSGGSAPSTLAAQFVHSALGRVSPVPGSVPSGAASALPAVVWAEDLLRPATVAGVPGLASLHFALYDAGSSLPKAVEVDRLALSFLDAAEPTFVASPAARRTFFLCSGGGPYSGTTTDLCEAPIAQASGTVTSTVVLGNASGFAFREDTGLLLAADASGLLLEMDVLAAGQPIRLTPILDRVMAGTLTAGGSGLPLANFFGFTPDGAHAWAVMDPTRDLAPMGLGLGELYALDLRRRTRANLFPIAVPLAVPNGALPQGRFRSEPCFLGDGSVANGLVGVGATPVDPWDRSVFEVVAAGPSTRTRLGLPPLRLAAGAQLDTPHWLLCAPSLDGAEVRLLANRATGRSAFVDAEVAWTGPSGTPQGALLAVILGQTAPLFSQPATWSPFGGPYLADGELLGTTSPSGQPAALWKIWGNAQANGGQIHPFVPVVTGFTPLPVFPATVATEAQAAMLFTLSDPQDPAGSYPFRAPLPGKVPPKMPLP